MNAVLDLPPLKVGSIKTFGALGPKYEVRELLHRLDDGDWLVRVLVVDTGEEADYRYSRMRNDPEAR
jgi:hypothetical protein